MDIQLIATDMDGTFLDEKGRIDRERFADLLDRLEAKGIPFVIASGNGMDRLLQLCKGFEDRLIFVADNGAHIYQAGQTRVRLAMAEQELLAVLDFFEGKWASICLMLANDDAIFMQAGAGRPFADADLPIEEEQMQAFLAKVRLVEDLREVVGREMISKLGFWVPEEQVESWTASFNQAFQGQLQAVTSGYGSVDILPFGIHKAWGLEQVLAEQGISPAAVMAFGDSDNDIEMLELVGHSYAMENATEKVKAVAKYGAPAHDQAGVFQVIEAYLGQEEK
ncbi:TPA: Cof-type HAD-IIB family hydrolase [Streptococcus suis]